MASGIAAQSSGESDGPDRLRKRKADDPPEREPTRQERLRTRLIEAGLELFERHGFDGTRVEEIVEAVGISRRSFFRYFESKDDVVFNWLIEQGDFMCPHVAKRPVDEPALLSMRHAYLELAKALDHDSTQAASFCRIIFETPSLARRFREENARWEGEIADILRRGRSLTRAQDFAARVQISMATTAFVAAVRAWAADQQRSELRTWFKAAFAALQAGLEQLGPRR